MARQMTNNSASPHRHGFTTSFELYRFFRQLMIKTENIKDLLRALEVNTLSAMEVLLKLQELKLLMR